MSGKCWVLMVLIGLLAFIVGPGLLYWSVWRLLSPEGFWQAIAFIALAGFVVEPLLICLGVLVCGVCYVCLAE